MTTFTNTSLYYLLGQTELELRQSFHDMDSKAGELYRKWQLSDAGGKYYKLSLSDYT